MTAALELTRTDDHVIQHGLRMFTSFAPMKVTTSDLLYIGFCMVDATYFLTDLEIP